MGQTYRCVGEEPYTRRDGTDTTLMVWESECAKCGQAFKFKTPVAASKFIPNRRCAKHKRPGARVA